VKPISPNVTKPIRFTYLVIPFAFLLSALIALAVGASSGNHSHWDVLYPGVGASPPDVPNPPLIEELKTKLAAQKTPIWVSNGIPVSQLEKPNQEDLFDGFFSQNQVALFRGSFAADQVLLDAQLLIFADTRYEVWFDGKWVGRGPARFSTTLREIDQYSLGQIQPGRHIIAVLVQWAPNNRRSESTRPMLIAEIDAKTGLRTQKFLQTGPEWKATIADAWQSDAAIVHSSGLIGPTELLDLRRLPANWQQMDFSDQDWPHAELLDPVNPDSVDRVGNEGPMEDGVEIYSSRSISNLVEYGMPFTIHETGLASPNCSMVEIVDGLNPPYSLGISVAASTSLTLETLSVIDPIPLNVKVDGVDVRWQAAGKERLDVYQALFSDESSLILDEGLHQIEFSQIPADGATFCIAKQGIKLVSSPDVNIVDRSQPRQGNNAGRRTSLAQLVPDAARESGHVLVHSDGVNTSGMDIQFQTPSGQAAYVILDAGRTIHGRIRATISGPSGSVVDVGWDERFRAGDPFMTSVRPYPYLGSLYPYWNQVDSWVLDGTERLLTTIDARSGRYILIISWNGGPVRISNLQVLEERYPLDQIGEFHSSDPLLDHIWQVGIDTLLPNMTDALTDTPWRERGQWWGDAHADYRIAQTTFRDQTLLRRGLIYMADAMLIDPAPGKAPNNQGLHMLDYAMLWVQDLFSYLQIVDDWSLARQMFPSLDQLMEHLTELENDRTGLLDLPEGHWSTTAYIDVIGYHNRFGQSAALNSLYSDTLKRAAWIAARLDNPEKASQWEQKAKKIKRVVNIKLYREKDQSYWTRLDSAGVYPPSVSAQSWALAYDMIPEGQRQAATDVLLDLISKDPANPNIGTYGMLWALEALGKAGRYQQAIDLIRLYYGYMLQSGTSTWWEGFHALVYPETSISHGWSGAPTWFLSTYILGARQVSANEWQIQPSFTGVQRASGKLPLQSGALNVQWENTGCGESWLQIASPVETTGEVILPANWKDAKLLLDGNIIWDQNEPFLAQSVTAGVMDLITGRFKKSGLNPNIHLDQQGIHLSLPGGSYLLQASYRCNP